MTTSAPPRTFADLEPAGLEMAVTCQRCGHEAVVDDTDVAPAQPAHCRPPLSLRAVRRDRPSISRHASACRARR